jgi:hypothetical protein
MPWGAHKVLLAGHGRERADATADDRVLPRPAVQDVRVAKTLALAVYGHEALRHERPVCLARREDDAVERA